MQYEICHRDGHARRVKADEVEVVASGLILNADQPTDRSVNRKAMVAAFPAGEWSSCVATDAQLFSSAEVDDRIAVVVDRLRGEVVHMLRRAEVAADLQENVESVFTDKLEALDADF